MKLLNIFIFCSISLFGSNLIKSGDFVIDNEHKLMWQDSKDNIYKIVSHITAPEYCKNLTLGGFYDWRVPTVEEYKYIIDKTRDDEIMIDKAFKYILPVGYWAKDRHWRTLGKWGYYIFFKSGTAYIENRTYPKLVRCVRDLK
ncbi:MAG: DUF1566 domain-containing protein [Campylobacterota bacterium]|nr:DUF1566 domain-containing protein [Campylobacterota bacterium]